MWEALREAGGGASAVRRALSGCVSAAQGGERDWSGFSATNPVTHLSSRLSPSRSTWRHDEERWELSHQAVWGSHLCTCPAAQKTSTWRLCGGSAASRLVLLYTHTQLIQIREAGYKTSSLIFSLYLCSSGTVVPDLIFLRRLSPLQQLRCCCSAQVNSCDGFKAKRLWLSLIGIWSINVSQHTKQGSLKVDTFVCLKIFGAPGESFFFFWMLKKMTSLCC